MRKNEPDWDKFRKYFHAMGSFSLLVICSIALLWMMKEYFYFVMNCFVVNHSYFNSLDGLQKSLTFAGLGIYPLLSYFIVAYIKRIIGFRKINGNIQKSPVSFFVKGLK